jgi:hypothetical protein
MLKFGKEATQVRVTVPLCLGGAEITLLITTTVAKCSEDDNHITNRNFPECEADILDCITQHLALFEGWAKSNGGNFKILNLIDLFGLPDVNSKKRTASEAGPIWFANNPVLLTALPMRIRPRPRWRLGPRPRRRLGWMASLLRPSQVWAVANESDWRAW